MCEIKDKPTTPYYFVDLAPVDNANIEGSYEDALNSALENDKIKNIALTGPYGSGKSSIIKTFEKKNRGKYNFLNISLASFKETKKTDDGGALEVDSAQIERSILQQMLYGADASKLPFSRFKRIATPENALFKAVSLTIALIIPFILYHFKDGLLFSDYWTLDWWLGIILVTYTLSILVIIIASAYKSSFGLSLKKFSLKNMEIEQGEVSENSILNRHLDEIIYFFQETDYDVVVIEDLDRFGSPEIFVKLREINKLINDNEKTSGEMKFLYALKDGMFAHKSRAKFFDFIIPVIPVINSSNSLDKMQERIKGCDFTTGLNQQFLREVSLYLDDLRLIHNVFNEFMVYYDRLKTDKLSLTKLLAMMVYKNVYPNDFENLHHGKGALFDICKKKPEYIRVTKTRIQEKINELKNQIEQAKSEPARSIRELTDAYIGRVMISAPQNQAVYGIVINNQNVLFPQITVEHFESLTSEQNIFLANHPQNHPNYRVPMNKSFAQLEQEINPGETFLKRKNNLENKAIEQRNRIQQDIQKLEAEMVGLVEVPLHDLELSIDNLLAHNDIEDDRLLKYLVMNGYLDENYHDYVSSFHEGRITTNDRDFLLTIRSFNQPKPNQEINTPSEVVENMREADFSQKYVLNVTLIDYLLEIMGDNPKSIRQAIGFISQNFKKSEGFLGVYFSTGKHLDKFIHTMSHQWPGFGKAATSSEHGDQLVSCILRFVESDHICEKMNQDNLLTEYISEHRQNILASDFSLPDSYEVLKQLDIRFERLETLEENRALIEYAHLEHLYVINPENVLYILRAFSDEQDGDLSYREKENYTSILTAGSESLKEYIAQNLQQYIENVFLILPKNNDESEDAIKNLINNERLVARQPVAEDAKEAPNYPVIERNLRGQIISKQNHVFDSFEGIPSNIWSTLLDKEKVVISWKNISEYLEYEDQDVFLGSVDKEVVVTGLLGKQHIVDSLSQQKISSEELAEDDKKSLSRFILENNEINNADYSKLIKCLPYWYHDFPTEVSNEKAILLAKERTVRLTEDSFVYADGDSQLMAILIAYNFDEYLENKEKYPTDDDVRELLLLSDLLDEEKINICTDVTANGTNNSEQLLSLVADLLVENKVDITEINQEVLILIITKVNNIETSMRILLKCIPNWTEQETMAVFSQLSEPYNKIATYRHQPKITNDEYNLEIAKLLKERGFVSSIDVNDKHIKINTFRSVEHS